MQGQFSIEVKDGMIHISAPIDQPVTGITSGGHARLATTGAYTVPAENGGPRPDGLRVSYTLSRAWRKGERREWEEAQE